MMPILAGIITRQGNGVSSKQGGFLALSYVLGMSVSYSIAGVLVGLFGAELNLQAKLQTPWVLIPMASVFFLLALAMFGAFEIKLPNTMSEKLNAKQDRLTRLNTSNHMTRYLNVALMGAISALVVSPCVTAPLAGVLLYISGTGDALLGAAALFILSLGMGVPLILMGIGAGKLLPKSGAWMIEVKTFFAIILTATGIYLLARVLPENLITLMICILLLFSSLHLYNLLKNKENHGLKNLLISFLGLSIGYTMALFIGVLVGEIKPLTPLSFLTAHVTNNQNDNPSLIEDSLFVRFNRVDKMQEAIKNQPELAYMIDLYADWCTSCKDIEREIFDHPSIKSYQGNMLFYQLDITENLKEHTDYMSQNSLFGPPSMLFYTKSAIEVGRYQGEPTLKNVIGFIEKTLSL
jgi:thiol:disulfide interchange protein DsbD